MRRASVDGMDSNETTNRGDCKMELRELSLNLDQQRAAMYAIRKYQPHRGTHANMTNIGFFKAATVAEAIEAKLDDFNATTRKLAFEVLALYRDAKAHA